MELNFLRKKYPKFIYEKYSWRISKNNLEILFSFILEPGIKFQPKIIIENVSPKIIARVGDSTLNNLIFHLGLMEIPSYWKATCSPIIEIKAGHLNKEQISWWKNLIISGMGQFFYENRINWKKPDFLKIQNPTLRSPTSGSKRQLLNRYFVPFAGGRDSIITLEGLKEQSANWRKEIALFTVNPIEKIQRVVRVSGIKKQIIAKRFIDKKLLALNKKGYLNGHTPFTSLLSFISVFCAVIFDYKNIVFSNEKSANEGNVKYLGKIINHQWAKSSEFEKMFQKYCKRYLARNINCFSYLRKYGELEISKILIKYPQYFPVFSSCNAGMKIGASGEARWCGNCPKCLFVYMSLYPFLKEKELLKIFGKDFFEDKKLLPIMQQLVGERGFKPFECVGTKAESQLAFKLSLKKAQGSGKIPYLLTKII
jgi:hypothetical protein